MTVVYVLTNPAMPELVKIGRTEREIEVRMRELDVTGVPLPFECFYAAKVESADRVERALHEAFDDHRIRRSREFFRISPDKPRAVIRLLEIEEVTPGNDVVETEDDKNALDRARRRRTNFRFSLVGISAGAQLESVFDESITCTVHSDRRVLFRGQITSLSASALTIAKETGRTWAAVAGPDYWKYDGRTLTELRYESERDDEGED